MQDSLGIDKRIHIRDLFGRYPGARARGAAWVAKALLLSFATLLILLVTPDLPAQTPGTGAIVGTVNDPSGARVSDAHVKVVNNGTDFSREVLTTADGIFRCTLLPPGNYSLTIEAAGFETLSSPGIVVLSSNTTSIDFKLQIGTSTTTVEVAANSRAGRYAELGTRPNHEWTDHRGASAGQSELHANSCAFAWSDRWRSGCRRIRKEHAERDGERRKDDGEQFSVQRDRCEQPVGEFGVGFCTRSLVSPFRHPTRSRNSKYKPGMYDAGYGRSTGANIDIVSTAGQQCVSRQRSGSFFATTC